MTRDQFFEIIDEEIGLEDREKIEWAYSLAKYYHGDQMRDEGVRYFEHCRDVALLLVEYGPSSPSEIIVGFLHDVYEDQFVPRGMLKHLFGSEVDEALKTLSHEKPFYKSHGQMDKVPEGAQKYFDIIRKSSKMVRRVKLADRLHNMLTLEFCKPEKQLRKIEETKKFILPIAKITDKRFFDSLSAVCSRFSNKKKTSKK